METNLEKSVYKAICEIAKINTALEEHRVPMIQGKIPIEEAGNWLDEGYKLVMKLHEAREHLKFLQLEGYKHYE